MPTTIVIVDDQEVVREGLRALFRDMPEFDVVGEAWDRVSAVKLVQKLHPGVAIMDPALNSPNGIEAIREITKQVPSTRVLAFSNQSDGWSVRNALRVGASGYLLKSNTLEELKLAIEAVVTGEMYLGSRVSRVVVNGFVEGKLDTHSVVDILTPREIQVLQLVADGHTTKEIAHLLGLSGKTIDTHRKHVMEKLDSRNIASLIKFAIREGLTQLDS